MQTKIPVTLLATTILYMEEEALVLVDLILVQTNLNKVKMKCNSLRLQKRNLDSQLINLLILSKHHSMSNSINLCKLKKLRILQMKKIKWLRTPLTITTIAKL